MTSLEFAELWRKEKDMLLTIFMDESSGSEVATAIKTLGLSQTQMLGMQRILDLAMTDVMYSLLLGLDGCAAIGDRQKCYSIFAECGEQLCGNGQLESAAWEVFHSGR